jgi:hypothetical protein
MRATRAELTGLLGAYTQSDPEQQLPPEFPRSRIVRALLQGQAATGLKLLAIATIALRPLLRTGILRKLPLELLASRFLGLSR